MIRPPIPVFVAAALLAACASTPTYAPAATANGPGYSETQIESNRYFVSYRAGSPADAQLIQDYALLRAAELTLQRGHDWFIVDRRTLDENAYARSGPSIGVGLGGGSFGRSSGASVGVGLNFPLGGGGQRAQAATLEIRTGSGAKPDDANVYDARSTAASLRTRVMAAQ